MALTLALIGYGEVGQLFAREFVANGAAAAVYDRKFDDPFAREALAATAAQDKVRLADRPESAIEGADVVISAVTADQAVAAARAAAGRLRAGQVYVDLNSVSPRTKRAVAAALDGADFVEFAVMSPVAGLGLASPILAGGARAAELARRLNPLGMKIEVVSADIGVASATKLCRSIVIKGLEAIMVDLGLAGEGAGVTAGVLKSLTASYPGMDWARGVAHDADARRATRRATRRRDARGRADVGGNGAFGRLRRSHRRPARSLRRRNEESLMDLGLRGRVALVTGGSKGIGLACAEVLLAEGARVAIASRTQGHIDAALRRLAGGFGVAADFSDPDAALAAIDRVEREFGPIDALVNCAGAAKRKPADELSPQDWRDAMDAKFFTYINACDPLAKRMAARGRGVIVNVIGMGGKVASPTHLPGGAANAALMLATAGLGHAYAAKGVRVIGVNPGRQGRLADASARRRRQRRADARHRRPWPRLCRERRARHRRQSGAHRNGAACFGACSDRAATGRRGRGGAPARGRRHSARPDRGAAGDRRRRRLPVFRSRELSHRRDDRHGRRALSRALTACKQASRLIDRFTPAPRPICDDREPDCPDDVWFA